MTKIIENQHTTTTARGKNQRLFFWHDASWLKSSARAIGIEHVRRVLQQGYSGILSPDACQQIADRFDCTIPELVGLTQRLANLASTDKEAYKKLKGKLPSICCNPADWPNINHLPADYVAYPDTFILDYDHLNPEHVSDVFDHLKTFDGITDVWISPSGQGVKAFARIDQQTLAAHELTDSVGLLQPLDLAGRSMRFKWIVTKVIEQVDKAMPHGYQCDESANQLKRTCYVSQSLRYERANDGYFSIEADSDYCLYLASNSHKAKNKNASTAAVPTEIPDKYPAWIKAKLDSIPTAYDNPDGTRNRDNWATAIVGYAIGSGIEIGHLLAYVRQYINNRPAPEWPKYEAKILAKWSEWSRPVVECPIDEPSGYYLSDRQELVEDIFWHIKTKTPYYLAARTGDGKTKLMHDIGLSWSSVGEHTTVMVAPRRIILQQLHASNPDTTYLRIGSEGSEEGVTEAVQAGKLILCTINLLPKVMAAIESMGNSVADTLLVVDEAHLMASKSKQETAWNNVREVVKAGARPVYLSATPTPFIALYTPCQYYERPAPRSAIHYDVTATYLTDGHKPTAIATILQAIINDLNAGFTPVCMVNDTAMIDGIQRALKELYPNTAVHRVTSNEKEKEPYLNIAKAGKITASVVLCTSTLEVGVNIHANENQRISYIVWSAAHLVDNPINDGQTGRRYLNVDGKVQFVARSRIDNASDTTTRKIQLIIDSVPTSHYYSSDEFWDKANALESYTRKAIEREIADKVGNAVMYAVESATPTALRTSTMEADSRETEQHIISKHCAFASAELIGVPTPAGLKLILACCHGISSTIVDADVK